MSEVLIKNCGPIITGDVASPLRAAETAWLEDGLIRYLGPARENDENRADEVLDAKGLTLAPGLIDAHAHPPLNDYLSSYKAVDWAENYMAGGITSVISTGPYRTPGLPESVEGAKALAVTAREIWRNYRPKGIKVYGGALLPVPGLTEADIADLARAGIKVLGEVGMSRLQDLDEAAATVALAKKHGMVATAHSGGASSPDCASYGARELKAIKPDVICHLNGAPTPMADEDVEDLLANGDYYYDLITHGNVRVLLAVVKLAAEQGKLNKLMLGTNTPSMAGYSPMGLWTSIAAIANMNPQIHPAAIMALATGNVADCYGLKHGRIKEGHQADLLFLDAAYPDDDVFRTLRAGNMPSVASIMVDGRITLTACKNTPGPSRRPEYVRP